MTRNDERGRACRQAGFSLVEMIVSVGLFAIIMLISVGALLSLVDANRKARALESVMNNLNISLDSMVRAMRMGSVYNCGDTSIPAVDTSADCGYQLAPIRDPGTLFSFAPFGQSASDQSKRWSYAFTPASGSAGGKITRSQDGGATWIDITAPEVSIEDMKYYVVGSRSGDTTQPKVVIVVKGSAGSQQLKTRTTFYIQATAVQRSLDI